MQKIYDIDEGKPFDCTKIGCDLYWNAGRVIAVLRNRWQGQRDQIKLTLIGRMRLEDIGPSDKEALSEAAKNMINYLAHERQLKRGFAHGAWRVTSTGYTVR
jgi:hypothetical protein